ncbi:metallo-beta-lactamase domain-containing protein 1 [Aplysia californica]|uniref:Metallo-beta-lactamase domain-containing protein 1 n=1 Tax=Aplysia californica TaxID=6500 RepID=A0ABM0JXH4_APLCA|nr:metallo-beta-lactamase domain-containing protein 1 [Aplysia californica]XP_005103856.1 metallo-beta-lactamase domain-containing protein 1 [Aplysia californica]
MYEVIVLKEGYNHPETQGTTRAGATVTLLKGPSNIIVDTGSPWDKDVVLKGLAGHNLKPEDIQYVVCSHGHSDHVGNLNLFTQALFVVGYDICRGDQYLLHDFKEGIPYEIDEDVEVWPTPGHTGNDVSVVVKNTNLGTVAVVGDLFECEADLDCPSLWQDHSENPYLQEKCRINILREADYIVPGHGAMFHVPKESKKQLRVVMLSEEFFSCGETVSATKSECIIVETD